MSYFSRLTDIVTCSLSDILAKEADPSTAIGRIIAEMEEGLAGARRSVNTAAANAERIRKELDEHAAQAEFWRSQARERLHAGAEDDARLALFRKREVDDLMAGLELQHKAALATREHLTTTLYALEARLADARRRQQQLESGESAATAPVFHAGDTVDGVDGLRAAEIEDELDSLRRELEGG